MNGRAWTEPELQVLRELYPHVPTKDAAKALGRPLHNVYAKAHKLGLLKSEKFLASPESGRINKYRHDGRGAAARFQKGHVPANKGLRRPGYAPGRMAQTQFRKGQRSGIAAGNWRPVGTILRDSDGYLRIKVREAVHGKEATGFGNTGVWPLLQRHVWEQHHGPVPPKHMVVFKDRDKNNCSIENLELISMAENARRNSIWNRRYPPELLQAIQLNGVLKRKLRNHGEKQDQ